MRTAQPACASNDQMTDPRRAAIRESVTAGAALTPPLPGHERGRGVHRQLWTDGEFAGRHHRSHADRDAVWSDRRDRHGACRGGPALASPDTGSRGRWSSLRCWGRLFHRLSTRHLEIGSEILNRSAPNLLDLLIALVGGLAGAFTFLSSSLSSVIVGVAIATALVPPLTTYGILLVGPRTATGRNGCVLA